MTGTQVIMTFNFLCVAWQAVHFKAIKFVFHCAISEKMPSVQVPKFDGLYYHMKNMALAHAVRTNISISCLDGKIMFVPDLKKPKVYDYPINIA